MHFLASIHHLIRLNLVTVEAIEAFYTQSPFARFD